MSQVTPDTLLRAWELGMADSRSSARSSALLYAAGADDCGELSLGRRDSLLLDLRERLFGSRFEAWIACPHCSQGLEIGFEAADIKSATALGLGEPLTLRVGDYAVVCRPPTLGDLASIERLHSADQQYAELLGRLVVQSTCREHPCGVADLPGSVVDAIERALEDRDAQVLTDLGVNCNACGHQWSAQFDISVFLWIELERWAIRLLWEVSALAQAYGWHEIDLIKMTPWRRRRYLEMLGT